MECPNQSCKSKNVLGIAYRDKDGKLLLVFACCPGCGKRYKAELKEKAKPNGHR